MPECKFTRKICNQLRERGCLVFVCAGNRFGTPGMPDRYILTPILTGGVSIWMEFKAEHGQLQPLQRKVLEWINKRAPYSGFVIREAKDFGGVIEYNDKICGVFGNAEQLIEGILYVRSTRSRSDIAHD